jgi:hypothetical protein
MNRSIIPVAVVALLIGLGIGAFVFPRNTTTTTTELSFKSTTVYTTQSTTQLSTVTTTMMTAGNFATVTATQLNIQYYVGVETCTTLSGDATTSYLYDEGATTGASTIYPPFLPSEFVVTITTVDTAYFSTYSTATC